MSDGSATFAFTRCMRCTTIRTSTGRPRPSPARVVLPVAGDASGVQSVAASSFRITSARSHGCSRRRRSARWCSRPPRRWTGTGTSRSARTVTTSRRSSDGPVLPGGECANAAHVRSKPASTSVRWRDGWRSTARWWRSTVRSRQTSTHELPHSSSIEFRSRDDPSRHRIDSERPRRRFRDHRDLGVHTELLSDALVELIERGVVTGTHKRLNPGKVVTTFALGTRRSTTF